jgi:hypothetical protein
MGEAMNSLNAALLFVTMVAAFPAPATSSSCLSTLPHGLSSELSKRYPHHRMPTTADTAHSNCIEELRRRPCLLITEGDFDGDGRTDFAVLLPSRRPMAPPKLVAALRRAKSWRIEELRVGTDPNVGHLMLRTIPPGTYGDAVKTDDRGKPVSITSSTQGIVMATCESWSAGYFRIDGHWVVVALSD